MIKMNNKGFAVSTILYGILSLIIIILTLIFSVMKTSKDMNSGLVESLTDSMNKCAQEEANLEICYLDGCSNFQKRVDEYYGCIGSTGIIPPPPIPNDLGDVGNEIFDENEVSYDTGINFDEPSSDTNGNGLYYTNETTEDNKGIYYFRGNVENNYVKFANILWRIIRINEDGSVRLITQDSVGTSKYNNNGNDNAYVGYMYGTPGSSTYALTHANTNPSTMKTFLETWYEDTLLDYYDDKISYYAEFCVDRRKDDSHLGYGQNTTYYAFIVEGLQFSCSNPERDLFTTSVSTVGNKKLNYPVGLITSTEVIYAGVTDEINETVYLANGTNFWTMTPSYFEGKAYLAAVRGNGQGGSYSASGSIGVRPVIELKKDVKLQHSECSQVGTEACPYIIE